MGLWDDVRRELRRMVQGRSQENTAKAARYETPLELRGPEPDSLLTADDMQRATGFRPVGEPDRKSGGSENDVGYTRVCMWALTGGDELLINVTRIRDADALALYQSRTGWVDEEKPLEGVGDEATYYVTGDPDGGTELHVDARQGMFLVTLVHSSAAGATDITPLKELLGKVLSRLA